MFSKVSKNKWIQIYHYYYRQ